MRRANASRLGALLVFVAATGCGEHQGPGQVTAEALPTTRVAARLERQAALPAAVRPHGRANKQILFGDLHVHTTFSADAFAIALPLLGGEGVHPPADACDFARYCADLDFWSINDHAEGITPAHWQETVDSIRACNAVSADDQDPDTVAFLGWEWTQVGNTPEQHYGHKNVVLREFGPGRVPRRPIQAIRPEFTHMELPFLARLAPFADWENRQTYWDQQFQNAQVADTPVCAEGVPTRDLPDDCMEGARTPEGLYAKLDEWGFDHLVIPHGTTWGFNAPGGARLDLGLNAKDHDPASQRLLEIYSGHGNAEEYRRWRTFLRDEAGTPSCPAPTENYLACCWQAGEIIRGRCADVDDATCEARVETARHNYLAAGPAGFQTVPGASVQEWLDCGQCRDCFLPANGHVPMMSGQYGIAVGNFDEPSAPLHYRMGFIGSSDTHRARAGNGFKEFGLRRSADATLKNSRFMGTGDVTAESQAVVFSELPLQKRRDTERQASLYVTGGLVAVHAPSRDRNEIYDALEAREVYATSGDRTLLWFDLLNGPRGRTPMGSEVVQTEVPRFRVSATGAFFQKPGCPDFVEGALGPDRLQRLCLGECYHPSDQRKQITRIEIVRIRPQTGADEDIADLIDDPWRRFDCEPDTAGCMVEFEDSEFLALGRTAAYYARAIQEPTPAVNGAGLGCVSDGNGGCEEVTACAVGALEGEDCLANIEERAWSSPIWLDPAP